MFGPSSGWDRLEMVGRTGVDLFFILSGFIMIVTTAKASRGGPSARRFLWRRITRIYPPYLLVTLAIFGLYLVKPGLVNSSQEVPPDVVASFLMLPQDGPPLLLVGWTLVYEMYFYLIFAAGILLPRSLMPFFLGFWGILTALAGLLAQTNPFTELASSPLNLEFLLGVVVGWLYLKQRFVAPAIVGGVGIVVALLVYAMLAMGLDPHRGSLWGQVLVTGVALSAVTYGAVGLEAQGRLALPSLSLLLGDWSYSLYLTHVLALKPLSMALISVGASGTFAQVLSVPVAIVIAVLCGAAFFYLAERPLLRSIHDRSSRRSHVAATSPDQVLGRQ